VAVALVGAVVVLAMAFGFLNGFRDTSSAVALTVRTRALTPSVAVALAAGFNAVGAVSSGWLLMYFGDSWIRTPADSGGSVMLAGTLLAAIAWGVFGWWRGYPSSSTHALVGGLIGASWAASVLGHRGIDALSDVAWTVVAVPLILSPLLAFGVSFFLAPVMTWLVRYSQPSKAHATLRAAQSVGASIVAFGHGLQDGQRVIAVLMLATLGTAVDFSHIPPWTIAVTAAALGLGTLAGGWRITYTLSHRLVRVDPLRGFVSQLVTSTMLFFGALGLHWPLSTTHTVVTSVLGAGASQDYSAVNGRLLVRLVRFWLITPLTTAFLAFVFTLALSPLTRVPG
jgi:PiT family inorganic phosphate transporter